MAEESSKGSEPAEPPPPNAAATAPAKDKKTPRRKKLMIGAAVGLVLIIALVFGIPAIRAAFTTVSTDDAYVNSHVTFVAARVPGQVARVLVDDNNRVHKGDLIVQLDKEPYQVAVAVKKAAVDTANADLQAANATVHGIEAEASSRRWSLQHAMEDVANKTAELHTRVAAIDKSKAALVLAELEFERARQLVASDNIPRSEYDRRQAILLTARADIVQTLADANQTRVSLGLKALPLDSKELGDVPSDLDQTFSSVREAQSALIQSAAQLGVIHSYNQTPKEMLAEFEKRGSGDIDRTFARLAAEAPAVKQAEARLEAAKRDLAQAELDLRYCDVVAEIDGVITRRNVYPGNNIQAGQGLMAIRSSARSGSMPTSKGTQLRDLRRSASAPVDVNVDMYGSRRTFKGRISGFTDGTGSTLSLLPAQNATGNFIKVVQRLPVRIDLGRTTIPKRAPLFIRHLGRAGRPYQRTGDRARRRQVPPNRRATLTGRGRASGREMTVLAAASPRSASNPWLVAAIVVVPTFMEVLDTTIALVALRYIAGGLSATVDDGEWVLTSYLAANAIILPITGWLSARLGRRNYFLLSIAVFTLASGLCGIATSLNQLILFRVIQGLAGGGLQPSSQGVLLDAFPREKQGMAMTLFGLAALLAPIVGPTLGGWITDQYSWRWVFLDQRAGRLTGLRCLLYQAPGSRTISSKRA